MKNFDHAFFFLLAIVVPIVVLRNARRTAASGSAPALSREKNYRRNVVPWSVPVLILLYKWFGYGRPFGDLGLSFESPELLFAGLALLAALLISFFVASRTGLGRNYLMASAYARSGLHTPAVPKTKKEIPSFLALDLAETVSDEVVYRAFMLFYLSTYLPLPAAALIAVLIYVFSESFRGPAGMARAAVLGGTNMTLLVVAGSLWYPIAIQLGWRLARITTIATDLNGKPG